MTIHAAQRASSFRRLKNWLMVLFFLALLGGCAATGVYHVVEPGQTLYRIAKVYGKDEVELAKVNRITDPTRLTVGQRLYIPGASAPRQVPAAETGKASLPTPPAPPKVTPSKPAPVKPPPAKPTVKAPTPLPAETIPGPRPTPGTFLWPVRGQVVSEFGTVNGKVNKGLEIAVPHGTPVTAAAAGKVIYSNQGIRGYGNLVILEHADNYFSVYGFNAKNLVTLGSFVGQGEKIALSGTPPDGRTPRLHFEIRKGKAAVNPIFFLP
jgi:lipoprotein NlpD